MIKKKGKNKMKTNMLSWKTIPGISSGGGAKS